MIERLFTPSTSISPNCEYSNFALSAASSRRCLANSRASFFAHSGHLPSCGFCFSKISAKAKIEDDIQQDFDNAYRGIMGLPEGARKGVYLAYVYYLKLFGRIKQTAASRIQHERIRVPDRIKFALLAKTLVQSRLNVL